MRCLFFLIGEEQKEKRRGMREEKGDESAKGRGSNWTWRRQRGKKERKIQEMSAQERIGSARKESEDEEGKRMEGKGEGW